MFFSLFGLGTDSDFPKSIRNNRDFGLLKEDMHAFFMSPETVSGNVGRKLKYERKLSQKYFSQIYFKEGGCPLNSTRLDSTATLVEHEDKDRKTSTKPHQKEEEAPEDKSSTEPRNLFRSPSLPVVQRPLALHRRPTITFSSGIVAEPMLAEFVTPRPEAISPKHDTKVAAPRPKSEQYTKTEWYPASSLNTFREASHDEDAPLVSDASSSETRSLHRSSARRLPNGPNKWIPPILYDTRMQM